MTNKIITTDLQSNFVENALVTLYELELNPSVTLYFHPGLDDTLDEVKFHPVGQPAKNTLADANIYLALPMIMDGVEAQSDGASNRPAITVANVTNVFKATLDDNDFTFEDLIGKKLVRRRTFANYLVGHEDADTPYELPITSYYIDRIASKNNLSVTFELAAPFDVAGIKIPNRIVTGKYCPWIYQGYSDGKAGGCFWPTTSVITIGGTDYEIYYNNKEEPIIASSDYPTVTDTYSASATYNQDVFVSYNQKHWQSMTSSNTGNTPGTSPLYWRQIYSYSTWSSSTTYSVGQHVKHDGKIWKALVGGTNQTPMAGSVYWTRADLCSKTLEGCKCRFQALPVDGTNIPSAEMDTSKSLPFGGFPGSLKFS